MKTEDSVLVYRS